MIDVQKSLTDVHRAMQEMAHTFEAKIMELQNSGGDPEAIEQLVAGAQAMKDSAAIYLTWTAHYLQKLEEFENGVDETPSPDLR